MALSLGAVTPHLPLKTNQTPTSRPLSRGSIDFTTYSHTPQRSSARAAQGPVKALKCRPHVKYGSKDSMKSVLYCIIHVSCSVILQPRSLPQAAPRKTRCPRGSLAGCYKANPGEAFDHPPLARNRLSQGSSRSAFEVWRLKPQPRNVTFQLVRGRPSKNCTSAGCHIYI